MNSHSATASVNIQTSGQSIIVGSGGSGGGGNIGVSGIGINSGNSGLSNNIIGGSGILNHHQHLHHQNHHPHHQQQQQLQQQHQQQQQLHRTFAAPIANSVNNINSGSSSVVLDPWFLQTTHQQMPPTAPARQHKRSAPQPGLIVQQQQQQQQQLQLQQQQQQQQPQHIHQANHINLNPLHGSISSNKIQQIPPLNSPISPSQSHLFSASNSSVNISASNSILSPPTQQPSTSLPPSVSSSSSVASTQQNHHHHLQHHQQQQQQTQSLSSSSTSSSIIQQNVPTNNIMSTSLNSTQMHTHINLANSCNNISNNTTNNNNQSNNGNILNVILPLSTSQAIHVPSITMSTSLHGTNSTNLPTNFNNISNTSGVGGGGGGGGAGGVSGIASGDNNCGTMSSTSSGGGGGGGNCGISSWNGPSGSSSPQLRKCEVKLNAMPWFHGSITRDEAEHLLQPREDGLFLVRESTNFPGDYTLCVCFQGKVEHYRVKYLDNKLTIDDEEYFENLGQLVAHYEKDADGLCTQLIKCLQKQGKQEYCINSKDFLDKGWVIPETDLQLRESIGKGEFGDVLLGILRNEKVAVKMLKDDGAAQKFLAEASVMTTLEHPNLVRFIGLVFNNRHIFLVTEYMSKGSLVDYLRSRGRQHITKIDQINFAYDTCSGMEYLECKKVVHRDLAARNVLISEQCTAKVSDFGLAREECYNLEVGKLPIKWTAPEALKAARFSNKSDMWSFGILLWEIYSFGRVPYPRIPLVDVVKHVEVGYKMEAPDGCPPEIYEMMRQSWDLNPLRRPTFQELKVKLLQLKLTTT